MSTNSKSNSMDHKSNPPPPGKSSSFSSRNNPKYKEWEEGELAEPLHLHHDLATTNLPQILDDVDTFLHNHDHDSVEQQVPDCVLMLSKWLESTIHKYDSGSKLGQDPDDYNSFLQVLDRASKLSTTLSNFPNSNSNSNSFALHRTTYVLDKAMTLLERDLFDLLLDPRFTELIQSKTPKKSAKKSSSFGSIQDLSISALGLADNDSPTAANLDQDDFPAFSPEKIATLNKVATAMITAGYQAECCMAFRNFRRIAFKGFLQQSCGYMNVNMEEIPRMQWESLEAEIATWNKVVRHCTTVLFNAERRFYDSVLPNEYSLSHSLFSDVARGVVNNFLNFAGAVVLTKRSPEKLFKFLDMYETLRYLEPGIEDSYPERCAQELAYETATAKGRIAEAAASMFCDLENSIHSDNERIPVPNGAVHPLTRYIMNYLLYACEYKDALEQVFQQCLHISGHNESITTRVTDQQGKMEDGTPKNSPLAVQLMRIMDLLDSNVERKSKLYRDPALRYVFLMNNGRYIVQKVKGCVELHESMGDNWCRRRQSGLRLYHKSYQRETWSKVLKCLNPENLSTTQGNGNGKVSKQVLKERFKSFNNMFEEIHKTQSTWVVSDEQLQSELRVSISALVIPAYRSFLGRFKHHLEHSSRHVDKYIKYHPEDIETLIDDLFDGNATSMPRRR